jgi:putative FmdB family regulatory protein
VAVYEYRCSECSEITSHWCAIADRPASVACEHCGSPGAARIVSRSSVRLSSASKVARLDPKYDKRAEQALRNTSNADPERLLRRMKPFPKDSKD